VSPSSPGARGENSSIARNASGLPAAAEGRNLLEADWLAACRRIVTVHRELFDANPGIAARTVYSGIGEGGDRALVIDRRAEDAVFAELEVLAEDGHGFTAISEERGEVSFGNGESPWRVIVDPIDGSLNARRTLPSHALSLAVASGPTLADVEWGYVYDFGADEEFVSRRGIEATLDGAPLRAEGPGYGLEVVGLEAAKPERILPLVEALAGSAYRIRALGSIALSLCYVAAARFDGMVTTRPCRSVDAAAGQLIARQAGAAVVFPGYGLEEAPLDLAARYHVAAALDTDMLATLRQAQKRIE
jgi:myo-inositol-1(or 4)-monophosphatase